MLAYILMDIEGTTTPIAFVHDVLFPYARRELPRFVAAHPDTPPVAAALAAAGGVDGLLRWIDADMKHGALKTLQGLIWEEGYAAGTLKGDVYPDVPPALAGWRARGMRLGIYSSGSVLAQKLLFAHTNAGDLTGFFAHHFDTAIGAKREAGAYAHILRELELPGPAVAFLSDVEAELDAAATAGLRTLQIVRPGTTPARRHPTAADFAAATVRLNG
jgi:enolase-phosphatase E1